MSQLSKPLRLQPKQQTEGGEKMGVVLLASCGIGIHIKFAQFSQQCQISGIKISHSGDSQNNLRQQLLEHQHMLNFIDNGQQLQQLQYVNRMLVNKVENIIMLVQRGKAVINNCIFSLNYLVKSCTCVIPGVWIEREGELVMDNCQVKGHDTKKTIGVVCKLGVLELENSLVTKHNQGGVLMWGLKDNRSKIVRSAIEGNGVGINVVGEEFRVKIVDNSITENEIGIKIGIACQPQISHNTISANEQGIDINSAFPSISLNRIQKNKQNGITCRNQLNLFCKADIRKNVAIVGNGVNGILMQGKNNRSVIANNYLIGFNQQAGVRVSDEAFPLIIANRIHKNYKEGIILIEDSSAVIEHNNITYNILCNIALGGIGSHHTLISQNIISDSPGAGINLIKSQGCKLIRNDILRNHDGLVMVKSQDEIRRNYVAMNRNNGVLCKEYSSPRFIENFVTRNQGAGMFIREYSTISQSVIHSNIFVSNQIDIGLQEANNVFQQWLQHGNTIEGEIYYPQSLDCQII